MTFFPAVMIAAYFGGFWPGVLATILSALAANYFLTEQFLSFHATNVNNFAALILFVLVGTLISGLCESLHRARRRNVAEERRRSEEALFQERYLLHTLMDNLPDTIYFKDTASGFVRINRALSTYIGLNDPAEAVGKTDFDFFTEEHARLAYADEQEIIRTGQPVVGKEEKETRLDSHVRWVSTTKMPFRGKDGRIIGTFGVARDITNVKLAEEALRDSEHQWRSLTEALPQLVWTAPPDGACDYFSRQWTQYTGVGESQLLGWGWLGVLHPDDREPTRRLWTDSLAGRNPYDVEYRVRGQDGSYRWFKTRGVPIRDSTGNIVKWFGTCTDITAGKQLEEELRQANARLDVAVRGSNVGIWEIDMPDGVYRNGSVHCLNVWEQLGYDGAQSPTDHAAWRAHWHPDDEVGVERAVQAYLQGETKEFQTEYRVRHRDGSYRWVLSRGVAVRDAVGRPIRFAGSRFDITDRKRAEEALRESEERFRGTFENAAIGMGHVDVEGRFLRVNEKLCEIVGYTREEMLAKTFQEITYPEDLAADLEQFTSLMHGDLTSFSREKRFVRKDGSLVWVALSVSLQRDAAGRPVNTISIFQDISERKRLEEELRQAKEAAEAANQAKDEFLANVSHEIRTPMNAILGMTELALDTPLTEDQRQSLQTVKSAADSLLGIINDLLDFSKIEAGKLELDPADFSLRRALGDTLRALAVRAHRKGLELVCHVQADVPDALVGDAGRLRQVLLNLVGNAIKFTDSGEVVVQAEVAGEPTPEGEACLRLTVRDTGIGIRPDRQERIFRAFEQEDTSTTRKYGGTGLGLTIAARLVALMDGKIAVESELGRGSTFTFTARFGRQPHLPEQCTAEMPVLLQNLPVLIVDDNATNRRILEEWLHGWQMKPVAVGDAVAAMDALWHGTACGRPYALVLLDARMPDADGLALAGLIRQRAELSTTSIILLTSGDRPGDLARLREEQINAHLLKPVQQDELLGTIYRVMSRAVGEAARGAGRGVRSEVTEVALGRTGASSFVPRPSPLGPSLHILVAEDNEFNAQLLEQLLLRRGHRVRLANNGLEALSLVEEGAFDLMLLDIHMPQLDGFQVVQAVRERERAVGGHLHVIALTARARKEDRERCLAAGMDDFLAKPIQAANLWSALDRVVATRPPADGKSVDLLDPRVLLAACGGDAVILEKICKAFRARLPDHLTAVQDALREGDPIRLREAAHKLCGMVAAFSTVAGGVASDLEDHAAQGDLEAARPLVGQLETMAQELIRLTESQTLEAVRQHAEAANTPSAPAIR